MRVHPSFALLAAAAALKADAAAGLSDMVVDVTREVVNVETREEENLNYNARVFLCNFIACAQI